MHARTCMCTHTHARTHTHACIHAGTHTRIQAHTHAHTHTCVHAHTHTHYQVLRLCSWPNRWLATPFSIYLIQISNPFCCTQVKWRAVLVNVKDSYPTENMHVFLCHDFFMWQARHQTKRCMVSLVSTLCRSNDCYTRTMKILVPLVEDGVWVLARPSLQHADESRQ